MALSAMLTACGFALRGADSVENVLGSNIGLQCDSRNLFYACNQLAKNLNTGQNNEHTSPQFEVKIRGLPTKNRTFTIEDDASASEFELTRGLRVEVVEKDSREQVFFKELYKTQIYRETDATKISKDRERKAIEQTLDEELVNAVIRELSRIQLNANGG